MNVLAALLTNILISCVATGQLPVDLILVNGNIRTLDKKTPKAEAMAVAAGRIIAVGRNADIRSLAHPGTKILDAGGRLVIPGFNDAHVHWTGIGNRFSHLDLRAERSSEDVVKRIAESTSILPKGRWLLGAGLRADNAPSLDEIDAVSPDNPLLIYFTDPVSVLVNSTALRKAAGSLAHVTRDGRGMPTGILTGAAVTVVRNTLPADYFTNWAEIAETASNHAASLGVTSVQDMHSDDLAATLRTMARKIAFGSDASITDFNPLLGIHAAVNAGAGHAISVEEAVTAYTLGSAYAEFQEKEKGALEIGKVADFVILSEDIFTMDRTRINRVSVLTTVMDGKVVYEVK